MSEVKLKLEKPFTVHCGKIRQIYLLVTDNSLVVAVWHSSNGIGCISEVTLCQAQLVVGWVTVFGRSKWLHTTLVCNQPPRPTQPPALSGTGNEYRPKCGDALRLGSKGRFMPLVDARVGVR